MDQVSLMSAGDHGVTRSERARRASGIWTCGRDGPTSDGDTVPAEQRANLGLAVAPVAPERSQRRELPGSGPTRHGLGVNTKQCSYLGRRQQSVTFDRVVGHGSSNAALI